MKKLLLTASIALTVFFAQAQYYTLSFPNAGQNPGNVNTEDTEYPVGGGIGAGWTTILTTQASPTFSPVQSIPFAFEFNGNAVSQYKASSSGVVTFDLNAASAPASNAVALPNAGVPDSSICILGINGTGASDNIVTKTFGVAPNRQHWIQFSSYSASGTDWTYWSIVLEETTNNIHIVDQRTNGAVSLSLGIQFDAGSALAVNGSPAVPSYSINAADRSDNSYHTFYNGVQPMYDVMNVSIDNSVFHEVNTPNTITGTIRNLGSETVTSVDVNYTVDGGAAVTATVSGLNIASGASATYSHPTAWTPTMFNTYTIETEVTMVNGNMDSNTGDNLSSINILAHPPAVPRTPLLEAFTSSTCGPCAPGNINVNNVLSNFQGEYSKVNYQMSWPGTGDPYYTLEGGDRRTYYGVNSVPNIITDGANGLNSNSYTANDFTSAQVQPAFITMEAEAEVHNELTYEIINGQLEVVESKWVLNASSWYTPLINLPSNLVAHHAINEKLTFENIKSNGETQFEHVMKKMMPSAAGQTQSAVSANDTVMLTNTHEFVGDYRLSNDAGDPIVHSIEHSIEEFSDLEIVFWIQTPATGEIWQSYHQDVVVGEEVSNLTTIEENGEMIYVLDGDTFEMFGGVVVPLGIKGNNEPTVKVYPNPAKDVLYIAGTEGMANVTFFDVQGRAVKQVSTQSNTLQLSDLPAGMYIVRIENNDIVKNVRVSVTK
jgi:hypothetical protein